MKNIYALKMCENYFFNNVISYKLQVLMQEVKKTSHFCKKSCKIIENRLYYS